MCFVITRRDWSFLSNTRKAAESSSLYLEPPNRGLAGLEAPYASDVLSAGELSEVIAARYGTVVGVFATHRYHHVAGDARCVTPRNVVAAAMAFQRFLTQAT